MDGLTVEVAEKYRMGYQWAIGKTAYPLAVRFGIWYAESDWTDPRSAYIDYTRSEST